MAVLPGVLGYRPLRRTLQVRLGFDFGFRISDFCLQLTISNVTAQIVPSALSLSKTFRQISNPHSAIRIPQSSTGGTAIFVVSTQQFMKHPG
jgi:hypothetical protein